jgi:hypothetical protein
MALDPKIASIKAAGTYRFEFDKSQVVGVPANQVRLMVGFSKKGPFNTPVFVPDSSFFKQVFGDIDRNLEKKDSFFHRSCLSALERGPILALNLLSLDSDDEVQYRKFGTAATPEVQENLAVLGEYSRFYNQDKFWYPDSDAFLNLTNANPNTLNSATTNDLLNFVNLGKNPVSVIVRKAAASNVAGFNVTVENWYGTANVPGYLDKNSLISDFMVDVFIIEGNFGGDFAQSQPYARFSADPIFQDYFHPTKGLQRRLFQSDSTDTKIQEFFNLSEVNVIATYTASLLPDFIDLVGNNLFIEKLINADTATTGIFCAVNEELFSGDFLIDGVAGGIDLIGHNLEYTQSNSSQNDINFLSYQDTIVSNLEYPREAVTAQTVTVSSGDVIAVSSVSPNIRIQVQGSVGDDLYDAFASMAANTSSAVGTYILDDTLTKYVPVTAINITPTTVTVTLSGVGTSVSNFDDEVGTVYTFINAANIDMVVQEWSGSAITRNIIGSYGTDLYTAFANGTLTDGDEAVYEVSGTEYLSYLVSNEITYGYIHTGVVTGAGTVVPISNPVYNLPAVSITPYEDDKFTILTPLSEFSIQGSGVFLDSTGDSLATGTLGIHTLKGSLNLTIDIISDYTTDTALKANQILVLSTSPEAADLTVGNYLVHSEGLTEGHSRLTRINQVVGGLTTARYSSIPSGQTALLITCQSEILVDTVSSVKKVELYYPIDRWVDYLNIFTFNGFNLDPTKHIPNGTNERQNAILNGTLNGTNLFKALTDRDVINFRYVIDTFGNGIESGSKAIYTVLCQERKNAFAIINAPSAKDFKTNTDPKFTDATGALSTKFISEGGDLALNPTIRYSLPSQTQGASWGAFYFPYITVRDLGKNINVPPAAYVSNNFIAKYANALPWSLVAGVRRGVVGGTGVVGLEINLDKEDREYLEPFGLNPIVFQNGTGPTIFANKTAQQTTKSALSSINVREVVIYIQDGVEAILKNYLFEFNTAQTRLEIKTLADNFLTTVQNDDGVYDFRNIMDETNNTPEVIDQNVGILDTYIEPVRGMEVLVQRTTILKTGAISSGNFQ